MPQDRAPRPGPPNSVPLPPTVGRGSLSDGSQPSSGSGAAAAPAGTYFLGRYRVVDEIGIGGMASVHLARMDGPGGFQKWVAIKRIHPHLIEDESFIQMFLDEARVAARISHPNVATVFELGKHEDTYWIAMEYLHGEPLREVMRRTEELGQPMPPEIACRVIADAAEGLHSAHELLGKNGEKLNLIHRDVTPHNLFVTYDGNTKVVDFGIAKFSSRMSSTRAGTLKGKLAYMSPEQVQGETIDRRTDIFALGVVLWELTTGQRLFRMESDLDTLAKVQECNIPRPSTIVRGYPIDLEKIVMKALAKNRGERFRTAREFSRALQSLLMRRGLFIASDEVAGYMQSIFQDRIQKREAHLRWASEVTQTISVAGVVGPRPPPINEGSYNSEILAAQNPIRAMPPRPAAGAPPANYLASSGASPSVQTQAPTTVAPATARGFPPRAPIVLEERHPADDDGPTIQATAEQRAAIEYMPSNADEDYDDNDDTIVSPTQIDPASGIPVTAPVPAAGRPAPMAPAPYRPSPAAPQGPAGDQRTLPIGTQSPALPPGLQSPLGGPMGNINPYAATVPPNFAISDPSLPATRIGSQQDYGLGSGPRPALSPDGPPYPTFPEPLGAVVPPRQPSATQPRLFAPPGPGQMTQTAQALKRRVPMWLVALSSGLAALFVAGIVFLIVTRATTSGTPPAASNSTRATASASVALPTPTSTPSASTSAATAPAGPLFGSARQGFLATIVAPAPSTMAPTPPSSASATSDMNIDEPTVVPATAAPTVDNPPPPTPTPPPRSASRTPPPPQPQPQPAPRRVPSSSSDSSSNAQGQLTVICIPACTQVFDNGKALGSSPIFKQAVNVGSHRLKLVGDGGYTKVVSVTVVVDQLSVVRQSMSP